MPPITPAQALEIFWQTSASPQGKVLVAVSGGPDSLALLHALLQMRSGYPALEVAVAHLNHLIRGEQAAADAQFVADFCREAGITCHLAEYDVPAYAERAGLSLEDAARRVRYAFLNKLTVEYGYNLVLTGHTADDQAETVMMRLLRGTGLHGLAGIAPLTKLPLTDPHLTQFLTMPPTAMLGRPFLKVWRREIEAYCAEHHLTPRHDETNDQTLYRRNQIRLDLLPYIENNYQPHFKANLVRLSELSRADQEWLDQLVEAEFKTQTEVHRDEISFSKDYFVKQPQALQRRLIRRAIQFLKDLQNVDAAHIEAVIELFTGEEQGQLFLPGPLLAFQRQGEIGLRLPGPVSWTPTTADLPVPGVLQGGGGGWTLEVHLLKATEAGTVQTQTNRYRAWLDFAKVGPKLQVRPRQAGERYRPLGAPGRRKVQDIMLEAHIPRELRPVWPVLVRPAQANEPETIVWIPGAPIAHDFRVTETTETIYDLRFTIESGQ
jgi:tRNA(Ile)-lysidine synthase